MPSIQGGLLVRRGLAPRCYSARVLDRSETLDAQRRACETDVSNKEERRRQNDRKWVRQCEGQENSVADSDCGGSVAQQLSDGACPLEPETDRLFALIASFQLHPAWPCPALPCPDPIAALTTTYWYNRSKHYCTGDRLSILLVAIQHQSCMLSDPRYLQLLGHIHRTDVGLCPQCWS